AFAALVAVITAHREARAEAAAGGAEPATENPETRELVDGSARSWALLSTSSRSGWVARLAAVVAPGAAMVAWLAWIEWALGDADTPLRVQSELRDGTHLPPLRLIEGVGEIFADPLGDGLHIPFAVCIVALAWVAWRRLPPAWAAYAVAAALVILSAGNLNSIE